MNEGLKKVMEAIGSDKAFAEKMSKCKSPEEAYEAAKSVADGYTLEEFKNEMTKLQDILSKVQNGEISEEDLKAVSGGLTEIDILGITAGGVAVAGTASVIALSAAGTV